MREKILKKLGAIKISILNINASKHLNFMKSPVFNFSMIIIALTILSYLLFNWSVVAKVDSAYITKFQLYQRLEKNYGTQTVDDLINEMIIRKAIQESKIEISQELINDEYEKLSNQFKTNENGDINIAGRWLSKTDIMTQIKTELSIKEILKSRAMPTESEIQNEYATNKEKKYKDKELSDIRDDIEATIFERKLQDEFNKWLEDIKYNSYIKKS